MKGDGLELGLLGREVGVRWGCGTVGRGRGESSGRYEGWAVGQGGHLAWP